MQPILTFIHITDSHIGPTRDTTKHSTNVYNALERAVKTINAFPIQPDFVLHSGDVSDDGSAESIELAAGILARLNAPVYYVNGNHDDRALLRKVLGATGGDPGTPLDYTFEVNGERFLVLDAHTPDVPQPQGKLSNAQLEWIRREAQPDGPPLTVLMHFVPFPMALPWLDENMILVNGDALHTALLPARDRLRAVFFGHLHRSSQIVRDGITYVCAPSCAFQYAWRPWAERPEYDPVSPPGYNVVHYLREQIVVMEYAFERP
ncbi:MAG: metallophosphoesterase [Anaerolineae bacterium]|nr:metallophosphoesterase [Anaerolineae bacterium]